MASTVSLLHRRASERPTTRTLVSRRWDLNAAQVSGYVARFARVFADRGIRPRDAVLIACDNDLSFLLTFALEQIGAVSAVAPSSTVPPFFANAWFITDRNDRRNDGPRIVIDDDFMALLVTVEPLSQPSAALTEDSLVRIIFSSGTTGTPVGVPFTLAQVVARTTAAEETWMPDRPFLSLITMASASGYLTACANVRSGDCYFSPGDPIDNERLLRSNYIATVKASPLQLAAVCDVIREPLIDLTWIESAGAPIAPPLARRLHQWAPNATLTNLYGSTEAGTVAIGVVAADGITDPATVVPGSEIEVVDSDDRVVEDGTEGEIRWRRPYQATQYVTGERTSLRDGWFYPGDRAVRHADGTLTLLGRVDNVLNIGGVKVQLEALDAAVEERTGLRDVAFFDAPTANGGVELVFAIANGQSGVTTTINDELVAITGLADVAIFHIDVLPRTPTGKVQRTLIRSAFLRATSRS